MARDPALGRALVALRAGQLVAYPTETLYGLGCALEDEPLRRLYEAKGLPADRTVSILFSDYEAAAPYIVRTPMADALAAAFLPGPLTLVCTATDLVPKRVLGGGTTVGIRVSPDPIAQRLAAEAPLVSTSANRHGGSEPKDADDIRRTLGDQIQVIIDDGPRPGPGSTVVDVSGPDLRILREGAIRGTALGRVTNALLP